MESFVEIIGKTHPCREEQLTELYGYLGYPGEPLLDSIFIYGDTGTGKTTIISKTLQYFNYNHAIINLVECYSNKILFGTILNALSGEEDENDPYFTPKCENMMDFVDTLRQLYAEDLEKPIIIVLDKAERLRNMDANLLPSFLALSHLTELNICTIFLTSIIFEKYPSKIYLREPFKIHFPQYTKDEIFKIISTQRELFIKYAAKQLKADKEITKSIGTEEFFGNYLNAFLSVFYRLCRDLVELRQMARINFVKYCIPVCNGSVRSDDVTKLWRNIAPALKASLEVLYLRMNIDQSQSEVLDDPNHRDIESRMERLGIRKEDVQMMPHSFDKHLIDELTSTKSFAQSFELPFYAKFLLIAAYLASYNPAKEDKRLFMKHHGKQRKRMQQVNAKAVLSDKLNLQLGPKYFTLDRLLAIFYAILEERVGLTANLICQVSSLVSLQLLSTSLDGSKYKCMVGYDFVQSISRMVGFNIRKYLYDLI